MLVCLEGAVGVGKTHFLKVIKNNTDNKVFVAEEIIKELSALVKSNYTNPVRYGNMFQVAMLQRKETATRLAMASKKAVKVIERCVDSNYNIFAKNAHSKGFMSDIDLYLYEKVYDLMRKNLKKPDVYIYLECKPEFAYDRIQSRGREGEKYYPISYFIDIMEAYTKWIEEIKNKGEKVYHLFIDKDFSDSELMNIFNEIINTEKELLKKKAKRIRKSQKR